MITLVVRSIANFSLPAPVMLKAVGVPVIDRVPTWALTALFSVIVKFWLSVMVREFSLTLVIVMVIGFGITPLSSAPTMVML